LKLFQLYHNKQELIEKREIGEKKKEEVMKLEKRKEVSDEEIKAKKKELAIYNKELATDEQKIKELVNRFIFETRKFLSEFFRKHKSIKIVRRISKQKKIQLIIRKNLILPSKTILTIFLLSRMMI
jgi:hypothetical protein